MQINASFLAHIAMVLSIPNSWKHRGCSEDCLNGDHRSYRPETMPDYEVMAECDPQGRPSHRRDGFVAASWTPLAPFTIVIGIRPQRSPAHLEKTPRILSRELPQIAGNQIAILFGKLRIEQRRTNSPMTSAITPLIFPPISPRPWRFLL
jgi:hypothetical protein